jgi:hypothetical protein
MWLRCLGTRAQVILRLGSPVLTSSGPLRRSDCRHHPFNDGVGDAALVALPSKFQARAGRPRMRIAEERVRRQGAVLRFGAARTPRFFEPADDHLGERWLGELLQAFETSWSSRMVACAPAIKWNVTR